MGLCAIFAWISCKKQEVFMTEVMRAGGSDTSIRYVAPDPLGTGDGMSAANAADFLDYDFWDDVQDSLQDHPVVVKFIGGNYERAYSNNSLRIENRGHAVNRLTLEGDSSGNTIFTAVVTAGVTKSQLVKVMDSQNIVIRNFNFTGDGSINYALSITSGPGQNTERIRIENCTWKDMRGIVYGATGATQEGTHHVTFINCDFRRIGLSAGSHMIYNAYGAKYVSVVDSYFEDCPGDYVRFRDKCDYGLVKGCTFYHPQYIPGIKYINLPLYNDGTPFPGNEEFATNYAFFNNSFSSVYLNTHGIGFMNRGYSPPHLSYLLTPAEGAILETGTTAQKTALMENNFMLLADSIRVHNNVYSKVYTDILLRSLPDYGATSLGYSGGGDIAGTLHNSAVPFSWENEYNF